MTSFARATFDAAGYLAARPTYPPRLFDIITTYHGKTGRWDRLLDIGCGPGFVALALSPKFRHITAIDPSKGMIEKGIQPGDPTTSRIEYKVGTAEDLEGVGIGKGEAGVDLVVAGVFALEIIEVHFLGQAAHWFDYPKVWKSLTSSVRPGGTVAFIGYAEMIFPNHPKLNSLISKHSHQDLGKFWQPGRKIVEALLDPVPFPILPSSLSLDSLELLPPLEPGGGHPLSPDIKESKLELPKGIHLDSDAWDPESAVRLKEDSQAGPWLMRKSFTQGNLETYLRSWSALQEYYEANPDDLRQKDSGKDIIGRLMAEIWKGREQEGEKGNEKDGEIEVGWPLVLMMIKKRTAI